MVPPRSKLIERGLWILCRIHGVGCETTAGYDLTDTVLQYLFAVLFWIFLDGQEPSRGFVVVDLITKAHGMTLDVSW